MRDQQPSYFYRAPPATIARINCTTIFLSYSSVFWDLSSKSTTVSVQILTLAIWKGKLKRCKLIDPISTPKIAIGYEFAYENNCTSRRGGGSSMFQVVRYNRFKQFLLRNSQWWEASFFRFSSHFPAPPSPYHEASSIGNNNSTIERYRRLAEFIMI